MLFFDYFDLLSLAYPPMPSVVHTYCLHNTPTSRVDNDERDDIVVKLTADVTELNV